MDAPWTCAIESQADNNEFNELVKTMRPKSIPQVPKDGAPPLLPKRGDV
jgi:hypothetical protein